MSDSSSCAGRVYLVGAGPGDPGLITLRGIECMRSADVVLYDYLVNPVLTRHAGAQTDLLCVGKHGPGGQLWTQDQINAKMVELALSGKRVVRLKGGDPSVFARGGEELACLKKLGIPVEIVPGITAALAAASHAGVSITHRDWASSVALVTGHEGDGKRGPGVDFKALARFPGTLVIYMGVTTVGRWSQGLLSGGMDPATSVSLVRRCSWHDQQTRRCRLDEVESLLTPRSRFPPPVIAIVGAVADPDLVSDWFTDRPLFGQTIVVTRPIAGAQSLGRPLEVAGARVLYQPVIEIGTPEDTTEITRVMDEVGCLDWIVFSSVHGVEHFFGHLERRHQDVRVLKNARIASVGNATSAALRSRWICPDLQPDRYDGDALAERLVEQINGSSRANSDIRVLLVRANRGRDILPVTLRATGAVVDQVSFYESRDVESLPVDALQTWSDGEVDWVTVTSSAIARSLVRLVGKDALARTKIASLSPITSEVLRSMELVPTVQAHPYTMENLVERILEAESKG